MLTARVKTADASTFVLKRSESEQTRKNIFEAKANHVFKVIKVVFFFFHVLSAKEQCDIVNEHTVVGIKSTLNCISRPSLYPKCCAWSEKNSYNNKQISNGDGRKHKNRVSCCVGSQGLKSSFFSDGQLAECSAGAATEKGRRPLGASAS